MTVRAKPLIATDKLATIEDILRAFRQLDAQLESHNLQHFKLFNDAYNIVTVNVQQALEQGRFANPKQVVAFSVVFARYYFNAVNDTHQNRTSLAPAWAAMAEYAKLSSPPVFLSLMLGANAHITNDLPFVLNELSHHDLAKMNRILMKSGREIISVFDEPNKTLNFLKRHFRFLYYRPAMYTVLYWRVVAWRGYKKLHKDGTYASTVTRKSGQTAHRILRIAKLLPQVTVTL